jgi:hypothetical protein
MEAKPQNVPSTVERSHDAARKAVPQNIRRPKKDGIPGPLRPMWRVVLHRARPRDGLNAVPPIDLPGRDEQRFAPIRGTGEAMLKLIIVAALALATVTTGASAQNRKEHSRPMPPPQQPQPEKALPTPDDIARWMNDTIGHILEPVETIAHPPSP